MRSAYVHNSAKTQISTGLLHRCVHEGRKVSNYSRNGGMYTYTEHNDGLVFIVSSWTPLGLQSNIATMKRHLPALRQRAPDIGKRTAVGIIQQSDFNVWDNDNLQIPPTRPFVSVTICNIGGAR